MKTLFPVSVTADEKNQIKRLLGEAKIRYKVRTAKIIIQALKQLLKGDTK